jgi:hypothetical protein
MPFLTMGRTAHLALDLVLRQAPCTRLRVAARIVPACFPAKGVRCREWSSPHAVADIERWLQGKDGCAAAIESATGSNVTDYVARDGSNNIAITADVSDVAAMEAMLASPPPEVAARMEEHGVIPPLAAYVEA